MMQEVAEDYRRRLRRDCLAGQKRNGMAHLGLVEHIAPEVYIQFFRAVRDYKFQIGIRTNTIKDKKGKTKEYNIKFTHKGVFTFHLKQIAKSCRKLKKTAGNGSVASVTISEEKPAEFNFKVNNGTLKVTLRYKVVNKYGNSVSF